MFFVWLIVPEAFDLSTILIIALAATIVEGLSPKEVDNILIPLTVIVLVFLL